VRELEEASEKQTVVLHGELLHAVATEKPDPAALAQRATVEGLSYALEALAGLGRG
jgi:hypothetical protein